MTNNWKTMLPPTPESRSWRSPVETYFIHKDSIKPHTLLTIGAILQVSLCAFLPMKWAILPASIFILNSIISTLFQLRRPASTDYAAGVVPGRVTAQIPNRDGTYGAPSEKPVVVFHLGMQINHPLGLLAPGVKDVAKGFVAMNKDIAARRDELGLIGMSTWRADERRSNNSLCVIYYFRDVESVHQFAHEPIHREVWDWFHAAKHDHIGIYHETFCVPSRGYETIYMNCRPVLMGQGSTTIDIEGQEMWLNALVNSNTPLLKTQNARMGNIFAQTPKHEYEDEKEAIEDAE